MITNDWVIKNLSRLPAIRKEIAKMEADIKTREMRLKILKVEKDYLSMVTSVFEGEAIVEHAFGISQVVGDRHGDFYKTVQTSGYSGHWELGWGLNQTSHWIGLGWTKPQAEYMIKSWVAHGKVLTKEQAAEALAEIKKTKPKTKKKAK